MMLNRFFVFLLVTILFLVTEFVIVSLEKAKDEKDLSSVVADLNQTAESIFNGALISSEVLKEMIELSNGKGVTRKKFNLAAKQLIEDYGHVESIQLQQNGVLSYVYPFGDKAVIEHDILNSERRKPVHKEPILKKGFMIIGPAKLVKNGKRAFIVRRSVRVDDKAWGDVSSVVYLDSIVNVMDDLLSKNGFDNYVLKRSSERKAESEELISSKGNLDSLLVKIDVSFLNINWNLAVSKRNSDVCFKFLVFLSVSTLFYLFLLPVIYFIKYRGSEKQKFIFKNEAHTDFLTGLQNRRGFEHNIKTFHSRAEYGAVAIFDIDFFKKINDKYGHDVGDGVLVGFADFCRKHISDKYVLCRSGGEEFILLMPIIQLDQAEDICDQLRLIVSKENFEVDGWSIEVRISVGIAGYQNTNEIKSALTLADRALYRAKEAGRDRVCISQTSST